MTKCILSKNDEALLAKYEKIIKSLLKKAKSEDDEIIMPTDEFNSFVLLGYLVNKNYERYVDYIEDQRTAWGIKITKKLRVDRSSLLSAVKIIRKKTKRYRKVKCKS